MGGRPKEYLHLVNNGHIQCGNGWVNYSRPMEHLESSIPQFQAPAWICERPRCFEKVPKIFSQMVVASWMNPMVQSIRSKKKHKNKNPREQNCPTKPSNSNKPSTSKTQGTYGGGSGFFFYLPSHHPAPPPKLNHRPVRLQSPHWPCWCHIIAPNCSSKGSDQRTGLGPWKQKSQFGGPIASGNLMNGYLKMMGLGKSMLNFGYLC